LARVWRAIEVGGKAAWLPILIVSSFGLYYNCGNYGIQSRTDRATVKTVAVNMGAASGDPSDPDVPWHHEYINNGKQDATGFKLVHEAAKVEIELLKAPSSFFTREDF
jgi:hypothetical protein